MSLLLFILGQWREHGVVLSVVTLAGILSAANVSSLVNSGELVPAAAWGIVLLATSSYFLLATLLTTWSQSDAVILRVVGAPRWLSPVLILIHGVGIAGGSTLVGLLLRRWVLGGDSWTQDACLLVVAMILAGIGSIVPTYRLWRVDLSEEIRRR